MPPVWASYREHIQDDFGLQPPVNLGPDVNTSFGEQGADYFETDTTGAISSFFTPVNLGPVVKQQR